MGENRDSYSGQRKDKGEVCPEAEEITKTEEPLIYTHMGKEAA